MYHADSLTKVFTTIENRLTGLGMDGYDSLSELKINDSFLYQNSRFLYDTFFHNLWQVRRVVSLRPFQMGNAWGKFVLGKGSQEKVAKVNKFLNGLRRKYQHGQMMANKDGASFIVRLVDDGELDFSQPVNRDRIRSVRYSRVFDRWEIYPDPTSYYTNPYNPEYYLTALNPEEKSLSIKSQIVRIPDGAYYGGVKAFYRIHRDRILRFRGDYVNVHTLQRNQGCESSILPGFLHPLMRYLAAMGYVSEAVKSFELVVFLIDNLLGMTETKKGQESLREKFRLNNLSMSTIKGLVSDRKKEDVKLISRNFTNIPEVLQELRYEMKGASGLDDIELFQEHPSGLQATGQSERLEKALKIMQLSDYEWSDNLIGDPTEDITGDIGYYLLSDESPLGTVGIEDDWAWSWNSAINLTPNEEAELRDRYATIDEKNIRNYVYTNEEARGRYATNEFNREIILLSDRVPEKPDINEMNKSEDNRDKKESIDDNKNDSTEKFVPEPDEELPMSDYDKILEELIADNADT